MKICYIIAMEAEAQPIIDYYGMQERKDFFAPLPCRLWTMPQAEHHNDHTGENDIFVATPGRQHDRDLIGCEPAAMATTLVIERLRPDMIINSGTCGAWARHGMKEGQVYLASSAMFHDRRVPGDNAWSTQGLGNYSVWEGSEQMARALSLGMGKVTTGSSFDMTAEEESVIEENGGQLKEMEGAAVAFVCSLYKVPVVLVKGVTNLRDEPEEDMTVFQQNLKKVSKELLKANIKIQKYLASLA